MFDRLIRRGIDPWLDRLAGPLVYWRISPNAVTVIGFGLGIGGCVAIACSWYLTGLALILLNRAADGLDGMVARRVGATDLGGFLDIVLDTIFYSAVPFSFALAKPEVALPAAFLIFSFVGTGGSFMAYAIMAAKRGQTADQEGKKSFFYSTGLMEGAETIIFFVAMCLLPSYFATLAWTFGGLCWITTMIRISLGVARFRKQ